MASTFDQSVAVVTALAGAPDVADALSHLLDDCKDVLKADAIAILEYGGDDEGSALEDLSLVRTTACLADGNPRTGQAVADIATLSVVHSQPVSPEQPAHRSHDLLDARELVEQTKDVNAWVEAADIGTPTICCTGGPTLPERR